jgi:gamma-glutamylcyclotransferase (GGCT)/AIG2-like uncharacterized protein YtfP
VYGTLQDPQIQLSAFGRTTEGTPDVLDGYRRDDITIDGSDYFIAVPDGAGGIDGRVLEVTPEELVDIDRYEGSEYRRLRVTLRSGVEAWFYAE